MKVDKRNWKHWVRLGRFAGNVAIAILARPFLRHRQRRRVLFYGHRLCGNLLPIYRHIRQDPGCGIDVAFLTMDPDYHRTLIAAGERSLLASSPDGLRWLATVDAIVSDHGVHALLPMLWLSDARFLDVWHGIPFKGFDAADFKVQRRFDEAWVASPLLKALYVERFGFDADRVHATGYARTDILVRRDGDVAEIRREFGIPPVGKVILFAPTWKQDEENRSIYPFGIPEREFLQILSALAQRNGACVVIRTHLNSGRGGGEILPGLVYSPFAERPETERLLLATDLLVCDWSSIAFDYLLLGRPAIFLDVEPPFRKGLSLDRSFRYGAVAGSPAELGEMAGLLLADDDAWESNYGRDAEGIKNRIYGDLADGKATGRCVERLGMILRT
jgi:CDP-glycerol glycerophosphotransferase (TagB/SpsB family)